MPTLKRCVKDEKAVDKRLVKDEGANDECSTDDNHKVTAVSQHESLSIKSAMTKSKPSDLQGTFNYASDIVGVVLSTTVRHQNASSDRSNPNYTRVRILIADYSLPNGQCARINVPSNTIRSELALRPGDIVRFNGMVARNADIEGEKSSSPMSKKQRNYTGGDTNQNAVADGGQNLLLNVVCDLYPSWKEPTSGPTIEILYRIDSQIQSDNPQLVTTRMKTPKDLIEKLSKWFCSTKQHLLSVSTAPQSCQRRKLRDITSSNVISHVVVKVLRCEKPSQRWSHAKNLGPEPCVTHATLSDGLESEDIMGLGGSVHVKQAGGDSCFIPKSISEILLQSLTEGSRILLTHVLSKSTSRESVTAGRESQILQPTRDTIATIITPDHPFYIKDSPQKDNAFASQPMTLEKSTQFYSLSQQHSPTNALADDLEKGCRGVMAVVSPLRDIIVDGIYASFLEGRYWQTNQSLSKFLIDTPTISTPFKSIKLRPSYRSATVVLDPSVFSQEMIVNADGNALKMLCMDVPAEDMVVDCHDDKEHPYLPHVGALLKGLCEEKSLIRWILEQESESSWFVSSAGLIEI